MTLTSPTVGGHNTYYCGGSQHLLLWGVTTPTTVGGHNTYYCGGSQHLLLWGVTTPTTVGGHNTYYCGGSQHLLLWGVTTLTTVGGHNTYYCGWSQHPLLWGVNTYYCGGHNTYYCGGSQHPLLWGVTTPTTVGGHNMTDHMTSPPVPQHVWVAASEVPCGHTPWMCDTWTQSSPPASHFSPANHLWPHLWHHTGSPAARLSSRWTGPAADQQNRYSRWVNCRFRSESECPRDSTPAVVFI